jgi:putative lipoprotein
MSPSLMTNVASVPAVLMVAAAATMWAKSAQAADPDPFWGRDKALHFAVAGALAGAGYAVTTTATPDRWKAFAVGGGVALGAGALKEGIDAMGSGDPSWNDFAWDAIGVVVGLGVAFVIDAGARGSWPPLSASRSPMRSSPLSVTWVF